MKTQDYLNPLHANGNKKMYLQFSFIHTDMTQVAETFPQVRPGHTYST